MSKTDKKSTKEKKPAKKLRSFYVPEFNTSVQAESASDAVSKLNNKEQ